MQFDEFAALVRARRTNLMMDRERDVDTQLVQQLCELSTWAPIHKLTWPWIFAEVRGEARLQLGGHLCQGDESPRRTRTTGS